MYKSEELFDTYNSQNSPGLVYHKEYVSLLILLYKDIGSVSMCCYLYFGLVPCTAAQNLETMCIAVA